MERRYAERYEAMLAECEVKPDLLKGMLERLTQFVRPFADELSTPQRQGYLHDYVAGLCSSVERKTSETIAYFLDQDRQGIQRFIGSLEWDHRPLVGRLVEQVAAELGEPDAVLVLDPSAVSKQGTESVGVKRQWNGRLAKVDNCQVGVYLGYVSRREQALVDMRLFLPKDWAKNKKRRKKCRVPPRLKFATKLELGRQMVQEHGAVLPHKWVVGDDEFGRSTQFRRDLRSDEERYLLAVPSNIRVRDLSADPPAYSGFGKRPQAPFVRVDAWCAALPPEAWTTIDVRDAEKGPLTVEIVCVPVLAMTERTHSDATEMLVITRRKESSAVVYDYWLSNAEPETPVAEFARVAKARGRIEECFKRAKSEAGLADYETRTWWGWHHHQTLVLLASWFLVRERLRGKKIDAGYYLPSTPESVGCVALHSHRPAPRRSYCPRTTYTSGPQRKSPVLSLEITQTLAAVAN